MLKIRKCLERFAYIFYTPLKLSKFARVAIFLKIYDTAFMTYVMIDIIAFLCNVGREYAYVASPIRR